MKATQVKLVLLGEWLLLLVLSWRDGTGYVPRGCAGLCVVVSGLQGRAAAREGLQALSWNLLENTLAGESHMLRSWSALTIMLFVILPPILHTTLAFIPTDSFPTAIQ
jgi:hypothetical protein